MFYWVSASRHVGCGVRRRQRETGVDVFRECEVFRHWRGGGWRGRSSCDECSSRNRSASQLETCLQCTPTPEKRPVNQQIIFRGVRCIPPFPLHSLHFRILHSPFFLCREVVPQIQLRGLRGGMCLLLPVGETIAATRERVWWPQMSSYFC